MKRVISALMVLCLLACTSLASAESPHFEGKPWINTSFYGLWPSERPAVEDNFELYANFDTYQDALARGDKRYYTPLGEAQLLADRQMASLFTDPSLIGTEAECMRVLYGLYQDTIASQDPFAPLRPYVERLRAAQSLEALAALIREDGWMYGNAFLNVNFNNAERQYGQYFINIIAADIFSYLMDQETFEILGWDTEPAKQHLMRLGWSGEEALQTVDGILAYVDQVGEWNTEPVTEAEKDLESRTASQLISAEDIRAFCVPLYEFFKARGLVKEGAEDVPAYRLLCNEYPPAK